MGESGDADVGAETDASEAANRGGASRVPGSQASPSPERANASDRRAAPTSAETPPAAAPESGDVAEAAEALRATLTKFSRKAADTDDPRRAREYLAAAREAAEALDALPY